MTIKGVPTQNLNTAVPKTMRDAIDDGLKDALVTLSHDQKTVIAAHIQNFFANKMSPMTLSNDPAEIISLAAELWTLVRWIPQTWTMKEIESCLSKPKT